MRKDGRTASVSLGRPWGVPRSISRCHLILCPSYCCFVGTVHTDNAIPCPCSGSRGAKSDLLPDSPNSSPRSLSEGKQGAIHRSPCYTTPGVQENPQEFGAGAWRPCRDPLPQIHLD